MASMTWPDKKTDWQWLWADSLTGVQARRSNSWRNVLDTQLTSLLAEIAHPAHEKSYWVNWIGRNEVRISASVPLDDGRYSDAFFQVTELCCFLEVSIKGLCNIIGWDGTTWSPDSDEMVVSVSELHEGSRWTHSDSVKSLLAVAG